MRTLRFCAAALLALCVTLSCLASAWSVELLSDKTSIAPGDIRALGGCSASQLGTILQQSRLSYTSALGVFGPVKLVKLAGVGINATALTDEITLGPNSLLVIPAEYAQYPTGLIDTERGTSDPRARIAFSPGARLYISNARLGQRYTLFSNALLVQASGTGQQLDLPATVISDSSLLVPQWESSYGDARPLSFRPAFIDEIYPRTSAAVQLFVLDALQKDIIGPAHVADASGGVRLLSRAIDNRYLGRDADAVARTLQSVQDFAQAGGVASMSWNAHQLLPDAMTQRTSFRAQGSALPSWVTEQNTGLAAGDSMVINGANDDTNAGPGHVSLWAQPLYRHWSYSDVGGMNVNFAHDLNANLGGLALGVDYTIPELLRMGLAAGMGTGFASSGEEYNTTENRMTFRSLGAYVALEWDDWLLAGDFSYTAANHRLTQELDHRLGMDDLKADIYTQSHGYNLRLEHRSAFDWFTAVEHVALGETWLNTQSYSAKSGGMTVLRGKPLHQQIGTFTAGLALERTFDITNERMGNWWLKPSFEYSVTYAYGDVQVLAPISLNGLGGVSMQAYSQTTVTDPVTHKLGFGLHGGKDALQLGLAYDHTASQHGQGHALRASFTWQF